MKRHLSTALLLASSIITGCAGAAQSRSVLDAHGDGVRQVQTPWVANQTVAPASLPAVVVQLVKQVCARYGEHNPQIVKAVTDLSEVDQQPMYDLTVQGHFSHLGDQRVELWMIVLADGSRAGVRTGDVGWDGDFTPTNAVSP